MANRDAMQNTSIRRPSASRFDAGSARDHNAPLQSQVVSTASSISKSVFTNAKSVFEFSKKKITEVYSKASEKISEQVDSFNAAPESRSAGGPYPDKGGAQGGSFWSDRWQEDNGDERQTYKKYETDSSSDEETLRKPVRKTTPYSDSAPSQSKWEANYSDNEEALRKPVRKTAPSADQTGSQARWESKVAETQPKSWDSGMPEFREMQWDSPAAKVPSPTFSKIPEKPKPQPVSLASQNQLKASEEFREKGNDKFKSGQFGEAEELYSQALNCLPAGDWGRIAFSTIALRPGSKRAITTVWSVIAPRFNL
ncbi:hypothetical protein BC829DRAFT_142778 [Chytridium lagenaria]|nr:hypothetical protein BC829DRAFT_142778 [Chytridium lagenaria]